MLEWAGPNLIFQYYEMSLKTREALTRWVTPQSQTGTERERELSGVSFPNAGAPPSLTSTLVSTFLVKKTQFKMVA